jgi:photosystem II stability/assembly factor-like uncharacterized protein
MRKLSQVIMVVVLAATLYCLALVGVTAQAAPTTAFLQAAPTTASTPAAQAALTTTSLQSASASATAVSAETAYAGWAVGYNDSGYGAIFRSIDGGATWQRQGSPATIPDVMLESVVALDPLTCWVVGESANGYGTILRTEDGGVTWTRQGSPATIPDVGLGKISAVDRYTAWVVGTPGIILFTSDGGATWTQKQTADIPAVLLQGVYALDADNVWVTGDIDNGYGTIFRTEDGGASWHRKGSAADVPDSALLDVHASDADTAWIASRGSTKPPAVSVLHTDDNGSSWIEQELGTGMLDTNSLTTIGDSIVWVATDADGIYRTDNAKDFVRQDSAHGKYSYYLVCIQALDANTAWAAGPAGGTSIPSGIVEHTSDGGKTWEIQLEIDIGMQAVSFAPSSTFYFAEGSTRPGFEPYLCVENPGDAAAEVAITYMLGGGTTSEQQLSVDASSRATVAVESFLGSSGDAAHDFGAVVTCTNGQVIACERPMYFDYQPSSGEGTGVAGGASSWIGGSCVVGATSLSNHWFFAEGCTGPGFEEWVCVLNPGEDPAGLTFRFQTQEEGEKVVGGQIVPPHSRSSFLVNDLLGRGYQTSLALESDQPVVAERPMYFDYVGTGTPKNWTGGHCVVGATSLSNAFYFAEGATRGGFDEWLTFQNPGTETITVNATYQFAFGQGDEVTRSYTVEPGRRRTVYVPAEVGEGKDVSVCLSCASPFLAERPMYFDYTAFGADWTGGHCVIGSDATAAEWFFAEGYTGTGFQEWLCLHNPGATDAQVEINYYTQEEGTLPVRAVTVPARSRMNVYVNDSAGPGYQLSCRVRVISGPDIVAERPIYFDYGSGWDGGDDVVGLRR